MIDEVVAEACGYDIADDPWTPQRLTWPLLETIDAHLSERWMSQVAAYLDPSRGDRSRRLRVAGQIARLYDRYATYRPQLLGEWEAGGQDERWQARLWRALRTRVARPSPVERLDEACRALRADPMVGSLPARLSLFGLTSLPARHLDVLAALRDSGREVHLFLLAPSAASWERIAEALSSEEAPRHRDAVGTGLLPSNPLLASWGRDGRELQLILARESPTAEQDYSLDATIDPVSLLGHLQEDVRADRLPSSGGELAADLSVQIHSCHGAARQVEVLRDAILHAFEADPSLQPRDVIVMCPDIETFAPLIQATFGAGETPESDETDTTPDPTAELRVRLADRSIRETNPLLGVIARLLELATARVTASEVLDLADREPVRNRFRFTQDEVSRLEEWVAATGARWGLDAAHRAPFGLQEVAEGTWSAALDRLLTGTALAEDEPHLFAGTLPYDDIDSSSIDLAGRFAELIERLRAVLIAFAGSRPIEDWMTALVDAADQLTDVPGRDIWQRAELQRLTADVLEEATQDDAVSSASVDVGDIAALLGDRLAGRPTRTNFRTGHLTICTLQPMRSVPHRVVCLLGLDDTVFPRRSPRDMDDLLLAEPMIGDRDARSEDRQILLDALMAASDRLIVTYSGNDERTNVERPPAVPVAELLDVIDRCTADGESVVTHHPLQPFDPRNFEAGRLTDGRPWSFDAVNLGGARALVSERQPPPPFLGGPLPATSDRALIELARLTDFLGRPVRGFLRQRLGVGATARGQDISDALPLDLDHLAQWGIGDRLVTAQLRGMSLGDARSAERVRGMLPPGAIGERRLDVMTERANLVLAAARDHFDLDAEQETVDVRVLLEGWRFLRGTVSGVTGDVVRHIEFTRISPQLRLRAWAQLLALTASYPEREFSAVSIGRARDDVRSRRQVTIAHLRLPEDLTSPDARQGWALRALSELVDLYERGMLEPLPIYWKTSVALATPPIPTARNRARKQWFTSYKPPREDLDEDHVRVLGPRVPFEDLLAEPPRDDERWFADSFDSRLEAYAHRLWDGLLAAEELTDL